MPVNQFKSIADIVDDVVNRHLPEGDINALSKQLDRIISCWPQCTNDQLSHNVKPVRLDDEVLIIETHSPVWANKMRYSVKAVLWKLHQLGFKEIKYIKIKVNPRLNLK